MHSRSFLHRTHAGPHAGTPHGGSGAAHPFGFADVGSRAPDGEAPGPRAPLGFAPPSPQFVTELSFRRTAPTSHVDPRSERPATGDGPVPSDGALGVGHASSWTPARAQSEEAAEDEVRAEVGDASTAPDEPPAGEGKTPFYKREISLRRRKPEPVTAPDEPIVTDPSAGEADTVAHDAPAIPIGFAPPPETDASRPEANGVEASAAAPDPGANGEGPSADQPVDVASSQSDDQTVLADAGAQDAEAQPGHDGVDSEVVDQPSSDADQDLAADTAAPANRSAIRSGRTRKAAPRTNGTKGGRSGRKVVGLKIGASQIAAAVVAPSDGGHELLALAREPLEPGIVVDGEVRDAEALRAALKTFFQEHGLPRKDVRIGVSSNRIGVRTVDISGIEDEARFDNAVRFKAHEVLPVSVSESVLDYRVVEERVTETGDIVRRVLLVVAPRDQLEPFAEACTDTGLKLAGIDLEALGLLRAFVEPQPMGSRLATDTATVVVAIGHESTTLLVAGGGACEFTRVFDWGGLSLQQAIALELDVHTADAVAILHGLSMTDAGRGDLDDEIRSRALDAVRTRLTPFARELVQSLQFYQAQDGSLGIGEIVITGGTSHLEGLGEALHQMIGVSVRVGDPLCRVSTGPIDPELRATIGSLAVPIGLAIHEAGERGVNLLPPELRGQRRKRPSALAVALPVAAAVPIAALGFLFVQAKADVSDQRSALEAVQAEIDALPEPTRPQIDPTLAVEQQQRAAALASVLGGRLAWERVLGDLSRALPRDVWLTKFSARTPDPAVTTATTAAAPTATPGVPVTPTGVTIEGYTYSLPDVALLLSRLGTVPSLTNVVLGTSEKKKIGKRNAISFTIIADIDGDGGAQ
jgi:type IV pilus assembly protein PilM